MTWNTRVAVVELIDAPSAGEAVAILTARLLAAGFEPYEGDHDAFPSEES